MDSKWGGGPPGQLQSILLTCPREGWLRPVRKRTECRCQAQRMEEADKERSGAVAEPQQGPKEDESRSLRPGLVEGGRERGRQGPLFFLPHEKHPRGLARQLSG